jgi:hypothetical protein
MATRSDPTEARDVHEGMAWSRGYNDTVSELQS